MPKAYQTPLQLERRRIAQGLSHDWPISRINRRPRGLDNTGRSNCYRHAALQNLLHLPRFLNWIRKHNEPDSHWPCLPTDPNRFLHLDGKAKDDPLLKEMGDEATGCIPCLLKTLINAYWGDVLIDTDEDQTPLPFLWDNSAIHRLHRLTERKYCCEPEGTSDRCRGLSKEEAKTRMQNARRENMVAQQDAEEFMALILDGIAMTIDVKNEPYGPELKNEYDALFTLTKTFNITCSECKKTVHDREEDALGLRINVSDTKNDTMQAGLDRDRFETHTSNKDSIISCRSDPPCDAPKGVTRTYERTINAAPEYLRVYLSRTHFNTTTFKTKKLRTQFDIPEILDLTSYVTAAKGMKPAPLEYKLLSGVYHSGAGIQSGHYVAGVTAAPPFLDSKKARLTTRRGRSKKSIGPLKHCWINDAKVTDWSAEDGVNVVTQDPVKRDGVNFNASILFYERIHKERKTGMVKPSGTVKVIKKTTKETEEKNKLIEETRKMIKDKEKMIKAIKEKERTSKEKENMIKKEEKMIKDEEKTIQEREKKKSGKKTEKIACKTHEMETRSGKASKPKEVKKPNAEQKGARRSARLQAKKAE